MGQFSVQLNTTPVTQPGNGPGAGITMLIESCDFGYLLPNGYGGDGFNSDFYLENTSIVINNCNFYGDLSPWPTGTAMRSVNVVISETAGTVVNPPTSGNCLKMRVWQGTVSNCWVRNQSGKQLDMPNGGAFTYTDCTFSSLSGSTSLAMGYATENTSFDQYVSPVFIGCEWYLSRSAAVWWMNAAGCAFDLSDAGNKFFWTDAGATLAVNRTNTSFGVDTTAITLGSGIEVGFASDGVTYAPPSGATLVPNPAAPPPASLLPGQTAAQPPLNP